MLPTSDSQIESGCKAHWASRSGIAWALDLLQICKVGIILPSENMSIISVRVSAFQQKSKTT